MRDSDITQTADVPLVDSSLVTDRDSERTTIYGQYGGGATLTHLRATAFTLYDTDRTGSHKQRRMDGRTDTQADRQEDG